MNIFRNIVISLIGTAFLLSCAHSPVARIPKENIPEGIDPLLRNRIEELYSRDAVIRAKGAYRLGDMGNRAVPAIPFLIEVLEDTTALVWVPRNFWQHAFEDKESEGEPTSPRLEAAKALEKIGEPAIEPLLTALKTRNYRVRMGVAMALGKIGDTRAIEPLIDAFHDEQYGVRRFAAQALGNIGEPAIEPLIEVLKKDRHVRERATEALGIIGEPAVKPLIGTLQDNNYQHRLWAARALGKTGDKRAVEPLINALKDNNHLVREHAAIALREITGQRFYLPFQGHRRWKRWWRENKDSLLYGK